MLIPSGYDRGPRELGLPILGHCENPWGSQNILGPYECDCYDEFPEELQAVSAVCRVNYPACRR